MWNEGERCCASGFSLRFLSSLCIPSSSPSQLTIYHCVIKCTAAECIPLVQLTQYAMCKYACSTSDDIELYNNKMAIGEQFIAFFVSLTLVHTVTIRSHFYFFQTTNILCWAIHTFIPVILVVRKTIFTFTKEYLQEEKAELLQ